MVEPRTRKLLNDSINILDGNAADASPTRRVFGTASAILALTRVSTLILIPPVDSHWEAKQDNMIHDEDSVQLSEYCFNVCMALETVIQRKNGDDLSKSVRIALEDLERCVD